MSTSTLKTQVITVNDLFESWGNGTYEKYFLSVHDGHYHIVEKPIKGKDDKNRTVYQIKYSYDSQVLTAVKFGDKQVIVGKFSEQKQQAIADVIDKPDNKPEKQQTNIILNVSDISVTTKQLVDNFSAYELQQIAIDLLKAVKDRLENPAKDKAIASNGKKPETTTAIASNGKKPETTTAIASNGKKPETTTAIANGKKPETTTAIASNGKNPETTGRKTNKNYENHWPLLEKMAKLDCKDGKTFPPHYRGKGISHEQIGQKFNVGKATVTEELRTYYWLLDIYKQDETTGKSILTNWKKGITTWSAINTAVKSGLHVVAEDTAIALAKGDIKMSYQQACDLKKQLSN